MEQKLWWFAYIEGVSELPDFVYFCVKFIFLSILIVYFEQQIFTQ